MAPQSHSLAPRLPARFLIVLALLLPLLVACGGAAPAAPQAGVSELRDGAGAPPAAPVVGGSGDSGVAIPATAPTAAAAAEPAVMAPAATAAPAATTAPEAVAAPVADAGGAPVQPAPERINNQQQGAPLKAGEVDDNADFAAYMEYLRSYNGPPARTVDVSERYILTIVNERQQPVLDAHVRLFDGQTMVFEGRTYSGGKTIVLPAALGISENASSLRVLVEKGNSAFEGTLARGQDETQTFVLRDAEALPQQPRLDVLFLLDATGSMGDEIGRIQETILSIAGRIDQIEPRPALRFGLVAYRDRGDEYVTRVYDFTPEVETFNRLLLSVRADGGGDTPESLNEGLHEAIQGVSWADDAVRLTFLVADAEPHLDYAQDYDYIQEARAAVARGVKVYPIAASNTGDQAEYVFRQIAQQTMGHFIFLTYQAGQNAGAPGDTTQHNVDPQAFTVERLDDLIVQVIERELAQAMGVS